MNEDIDSLITDRWITSSRGKKNQVNPYQPYGWLVEKERTPAGLIEDTGIIFLTNRECPYHCLMCDLWKNTTKETISSGAIAKQIEWALEQMPHIKHLKLYNSGSFFDRKAIPEKDYESIASLVKGFETLIVESHPGMISEKCIDFRKMLKPELNIAIGLETIHTGVLRKLNKRMTPDDFRKAVLFLTGNGIGTRAFILLRPPLLTESEAIYWAERSIDFAFDAGAECCVVIPVRAGNGAMDILQEKGYFSPPSLNSLEAVLEYGIGLKAGRVFADVWDLKIFSQCTSCLDRRTNRLIEMNLQQNNPERVKCNCSQ